MELATILNDYDEVTKACRQLLEQELQNVPEMAHRQQMTLGTQAAND